MFNSMRVLILFICSIVYSNEYSNIESQNSIEVNVLEQNNNRVVINYKINHYDINTINYLNEI